MVGGGAAGAGAAVIAAVLLCASAAHAEPSAADRETARALMQKGRELRDSGDLKGALQRFKGADDIMHVPSTAYEVAKVEVALGLLVEARDEVAAIRQMPAKASDPEPFKQARIKAEELDASLTGRIPSLTITVKGASPGQDAKVTIDGVAMPAGVLGLPHSVDPGHHVVTARIGTSEGKQEIDIAAGEQKPVELTLVVTAPPPTDTQEAPHFDEAPSPPPQPRKVHSPTALTFVGIAAAGAGAIAGTVFGLMSMSKTSTLQGECTNNICGPTSSDDLSSAQTFATISDVAFAVAGVGAVVAVVSLVVGHKEMSAPPQPSASASVRAMPWIGAGTAGVFGTF